MSDSGSSRRAKGPAQNPRTPLFEVRHQPLPPQPQPIQKARDPFEDLPDVRPRVARPPRVVTAAPLPERRSPADDEMDGWAAPTMRGALAETAADVHRAQLLGRPAYALPEPRRSIFELFQDHPVLIALVVLVCIAIIVLTSAPTRTVISRYGQPGGGSATTGAAVAAAPPSAPPGEHSVLGESTVSAEVIDAVLAKYGSPAAGTGRLWIELGGRYGIDPAYALAFFIHESTAGTNPGWAGLKPDGSSTHNIGNIICAGYPTCFGRFRDYGSWDEGIEDWYKLIAREYVAGRNVHTLEQIIPIYAPSFENNVPAYVQAVVTMVNEWRQGVHP